MRNLYLSLGVVIASNLAIGQELSSNFSLNDIQVPVQKHTTGTQKAKKTSLSVAKSTPIWTNDCSDINDFVLTNTSQPSLDWHVEMDPASIPVTALAPMGSLTASNGYLFINSDGIVGNADGNGTPVNATVRIADTLDLTNHSDVVLTFASNFRWWQEARTVRVSGDNGSTWTDFEISNTSASPESGQNTDNPTIEKIDITAVAGGQSQVLIEFVYFDNDFWAWYWAIDDIAVLEKNDNDLEVNNYFATDINNDFEYSMVPLNQVTPMSFGLQIENIGVNDLTGAGFSYDINDGSSSVASGANVSNPITSMAGATDSVFETTSFTPSGLGIYTYTLTAVSDSIDNDLTNDMASGSLEVTTDVWAVDDGSDEGSWSQLFDDDSTAEFKVGNNFLIQQADTIWSLDIEISNNNLGTTSDVFGEIWLFDGVSWGLVDVALAITLSPSDNGQWVNVDFAGGVPVSAGDNLVAFAGHYGGSNTERVSFVRGGKPGSVRLGLTDGTINGFAGDNAPVHVRLNFDRMSNNVGIEENNSLVNLAQNMPNPAKENTVIAYTLEANSDVVLKITDVNGRVISTITESNKAKGEHVINVNTTEMAQGVYQYTLITKAGSATKSMVVVK